MSLYQLQIANQLISLLYSTYTFLGFSSSSSGDPVKSNPISSFDKSDTLDEGEMNHMLKWMKMFFEAQHESDPYTQELFNLYMNIRSDFAGYLEHIRYNNSLWLFPSYRKRNLDALSRKIQTDLKMFTQGLQLFALMKNVNNKEACSHN